MYFTIQSINKIRYSFYIRFDDYVIAMIKDGVFPYYVPHFLTRFLKYTPKIALALTVGVLDGESIFISYRL